jgi:hypothetical protein
MPPSVVVEGLLVKVKALERRVVTLTTETEALRDVNARLSSLAQRVDSAVQLESTLTTLAAAFTATDDRLTQDLARIGGELQSLRAMHDGAVRELNRTPLGLLPASRFLNEDAASGHDLRLNVSYPSAVASYTLHNFSIETFSSLTYVVDKVGDRHFLTVTDSDGDQRLSSECPETLDIDYLVDYAFFEIFQFDPKSGSPAPFFSGYTEIAPSAPTPARGKVSVPAPAVSTQTTSPRLAVGGSGSAPPSKPGPARKESPRDSRTRR